MSLNSKLVQQAYHSASPYTNYSMKISKYYAGSKTPHIETQAFTINGNTNSTYAKRKMNNGNTFEMFRFNDDILKIIKNKFGEIISSKANFKIPLDDVQRVYMNSLDTMRSKLNSLHKVPEHMLNTRSM